MRLKRYFQTSTVTFELWELKSTERAKFLNCLPRQFKLCYLSKKDLEARLRLSKSATVASEYAEVLPDNPTIMSGDFGEILSFFIHKEIYKNQSVNGPKKWQWKTERNTPAPFTDVILFTSNKVASKKDILVSVESKMMSVKSKSTNPIEKSIEGAKQDYVTRIAASLAWIKRKIKEESAKSGANIRQLKNDLDKVERFIKPEAFGPYIKHVNAAAYIDKNLASDEISKTHVLPTLTDATFQLRVFVIEDLKSAYKDVFFRIPTA
jgi:hypothetical protein